MLEQYTAIKPLRSQEKENLLIILSEPNIVRLILATAAAPLVRSKLH